MMKLRNQRTYLITHFQKRLYTNNSRGLLKEYVYTKYRIALPYLENVKYDDLYLSSPNKEDFFVFTKKIPMFLRFLKLITFIENRNNDFIEFAKRCENGLSVERDIYLKKEELLELMFINGYTKKEMNAFDLAFTSNYEFHYPEIAVLFQLDEEEVYKYCLKKRSESPENLVHLKFTKSKNLLSSYGLIFLFLYFGLNNFVLCNAWFLSKTIPFFSVFYMLASYYYRDIWNFINKEKNLMLEQNRKNRLEGEDILYNQLKLYSNDSESSDLLKSFQKYMNKLILNYRKAYVAEHRRKVHECLENKLKEIYKAEEKYKSSLQNILLNEIIKHTYDTLKKDESFYNSVLNDSIHNIRGMSNPNDTLITHVKKGIDALKSMNKENPLVKRILDQYEIQKEEYVNQFKIHKEEIDMIRKLSTKCQMDITKLTDDEYQNLTQLFRSINDRFGFYVNLKETDLVVPRDEQSSHIVEKTNEVISSMNKRIREKQLKSFMQAFQ